MPTKVKVAASALRKKGFEENKDSDHVRYHLVFDGVRTGISTYMSHGERELAQFHESMMAKQLKVTKREFLNLIECPLSREGYLALLRERDEI
jgi:hypothetical protein